MEAHKAAIGRIAKVVRAFFERREPYRIFHGSTNSTRPMQHRGPVVDISALSHVLQVDTKTRTALVEPGVPMDRLVESTLKYGLIPPVVMEFPGITAGGGFAGTGGESSSFKYGYFNHTVNWIEMVLANGDVVKASNELHKDLFEGASGAVGTLGITTLLELQLIEAKNYVKTTYHPVQSTTGALDKIHQKITEPELDYVDGILFSNSHGAVITGSLTDDLPTGAQVQCFSGSRDPWFYLHVSEKTRNSKIPITEYIPLAEYLFRYDRGGFWVGASAFNYFKFPFNSFTRWWLDDFLHTRMLYRALHASGQSRKYIVQDLALPYTTVEQFIKYTSDTFRIWPIWLCPLKPTATPSFHPHATGSATGEPLMNVGLWGFGSQRLSEMLSKNRDLERRLGEFGGMKWLYAHTYYTEDEFWQIYGRSWYDELRAKYHATSLPTVYDKVRVDIEATKRQTDSSWRARVRSMWPLSGVWGIWKAIESKDYHIARKSTWKTNPTSLSKKPT